MASPLLESHFFLGVVVVVGFGTSEYLTAAAAAMFAVAAALLTAAETENKKIK